jgi:hypothetical protein
MMIAIWLFILFNFWIVLLYYLTYESGICGGVIVACNHVLFEAFFFFLLSSIRQVPPNEADFFDMIKVSPDKQTNYWLEGRDGYHLLNLKTNSSSHCIFERMKQQAPAPMLVVITKWK